MRKRFEKCFSVHLESGKRLSPVSRRILFALLLMLILFLLLSFQNVFALNQNTGFENGSTNWSFIGGGTFSINSSNSLYYRGGVQSLGLSTGSTSDSKAYNSNYTATAAANGTYITVIAWIRADGSNGEAAVGVYDVTSSTETKASAVFTPTTSGFTQMYYTFPATGGHVYYPYLYGRKVSGSPLNIYFDDVIIFNSTYSSSDLTEPAAPSGVSFSVSGTNITLSWTNGTDNESGIDGMMILRASGGQTSNQVLKDQCNYNTSSTYGPTTVGSYTVVYNGSLITSYTDNPGAVGSYTYLLVMRDQAYNYTPTTSQARALAIIGTNQSTTYSANTNIDGMYIAAGCTLNVSSTSTDTIRNSGIADIYGVINMQGNLQNGAGGTANFRSGSTYRFNRNGTSGYPIITANWLTGSTCSVEGITNANPSGTSQTFYNFTWNCGSQTGATSLPSNTFNVNGDLTITSTKTGNLTLNNHVLKGNFTHTGGTVYYTTNTTITFNGSTTQTINVAGPVENFYIDNNITLNGNLTLNKTITLHTGTFNNSSKTLTLASGAAIVRYTGTFSSAPTFNGNQSVTYMSPVTTGYELPTSNSDLSDLILNTTGDVTLNATAYINGNLYFTSGYLVTSATNLIIINNDATTSGGSASSFVKGPMEKAGNDAFTFDVGKTGYYKPISISAPGNVNGSFKTEYIRLDPNTYYDVTQKDASIDHLSRCEYWTMDKVQGPSQIYVTLSFDATSCGLNDLSSLIVVHWNGGQWKDEGQGSTTGTVSQGTIMSANAITNFNPPFTLGSRTGANPLPITLTSFEIKCKETPPTMQAPGKSAMAADLTWVTASEVNSDYFSVQRSEDGMNFNDIAKINAAGNKTTNTYYEYEDENPLSSATSFYRLKETDADGEFTLSKILSFHCSATDEAGLRTYSVSAFADNHHDLRIKYVSDLSSECVVNIYNVSGALIYKKNYSIKRGINEFQINDFDVTSGVYFVQVVQDGKYTPGKFFWQ